MLMSRLGQHNQTRLTELYKTTLETDDLYHFYVDALKALQLWRQKISNMC